MSAPLTLSFVVPIYNIGKIRTYFDEFVQSLLTQTYSHTEIIFVNDASPDNSADILQDLADQHSHIRILTHSHNQGQGPARNTGAAAATGDYIWFVDQDDLVAPNACQILADKIQAHSHPDIVCFQHCEGIESLNTQLSPPSQCITYEDYNKSKQHRIDIDCFLLRYYDGVHGTSWRHLIKTDLARSCQFPNFPHEDVVHTFEILVRANSLARVSATLYFWRRHDLNTHKTRDFSKAVSAYAKAFEVTQETARKFDHKEALQKYTRYHHAYRRRLCINEVYIMARILHFSKMQAVSTLEKLVPKTWSARLRFIRDIAGYRLYLKHCMLLTSVLELKPSRYTYYYQMVRVFIHVAIATIPLATLFSFSPSAYYKVRYSYSGFRKACTLVGKQAS